MLGDRRLRYFLAVAESLHFGRAADSLGVAQSALSRQVRELESDLGIRLLNRGRRSAVSLTGPGAVMYREASLAFQQLERAQEATRRAALGETGHVSIGYVASAALSGVLPRSLRRYKASCPSVEIRLAEMETPTQLAALRDGLIDVGFLRPRTGYPRGVKAVVVHREPMLLAVAATHELASRRVAIGNLSGETFIIPQFDETSGFAEQLAQLAALGGFEPRRILRVRDFLTALTLAAGDYGVVPAPQCTRALGVHNVIFKEIHGYAGSAELAMAYRERDNSAAIANFVKVASVSGPREAVR